jgi:hypothetical protein
MIEIRLFEHEIRKKVSNMVLQKLYFSQFGDTNSSRVNSFVHKIREESGRERERKVF